MNANLIPFVYDAGALIALDRDERSMRSKHRLALDEGRVVHVPAVVVTQVWRDPRRQHSLGSILLSCEITNVDAELARSAGVLCKRAGTDDAVDALVVASAITTGPAIVWTSDRKDLEHLRSVVDDPTRLVIRAC